MDDWRKHMTGRRGKFLKKPRETFTEEVFRTEKQKPAPSKYHKDNKNRILGVYES